MAEKKYLGADALIRLVAQIKAGFASLTHSHKLSDITDYTVDTTLSSTSTNPVQNKVIKSKFDSVDSAISGKAASSHTHTIANVTDLQTTLDAKATQSSLDAHTGDADVHFTTDERTKLAGIAAGAQKNTITGVKGNSESTYRTGNVNINKANIGLGNVDNTSDVNKPVSTKQQAAIDAAVSSITEGDVVVAEATHAVSADSATNATNATNADHAASADSATTATKAGQLSTARTITLAGDASGSVSFDGSKNVELSVTVADDSHAHIIANVDGLQTALDGKAASSHTHAIADVTDLQSTLDSLDSAIDGKAASGHSHSAATTSAAGFMSATDKSKLNGIASGAEVNQNAFANVVVGSTTIAADAKSDSLTIAAGTGISVAGDATNDKVTITNSGVRSISTGTSNGTISVNTNGTSANVAVKGLGSAAYTASTAYDAAGTAQTKADAALASAKEYADDIKNDLLNGAGTAYDTLKELGDLIDTNKDAIDALEEVASGKANATHTHAISDVTNLQTTLDGKAAKSHTHTVSQISDLTATAAELNVLDGITATTAELNYMDGVTSGVQGQLDTLTSAVAGKAASSHSHTITASASDDDIVVLSGTSGSNKVTYSASHATSGATAGSYGDSANQTPAYGGTFKVPYVTVNATGHVTGISAHTVKIPAAQTLSGLGVTATAAELNKLDGVTATTAELNYVDGVTSNIQSQLDELDSNKASKQDAVYYIEGTGDTAGVWLGSHDDITEYYNGLVVAYKIGIAGSSDGTTLNINSLGAVSVRRNTTSAVTTHYGVSAIVILTYTVDDSTAYWKIADYDSDSKTRTSNKTGTKMYIVGSTSQSSSYGTYSNKNCYIGTDNCLYSNGTKVLTAHQSLSDLGVTATAAELNKLDGVTATASELNILDGVTATTAELNTLDGITATVTELNYMDGVTGNVQSQLDSLTTAVSGKAASSHSHTITASASDDDVVVLTGTNGSNKVTYTASHANSGVTAGTYKSVTVDAKGHVTAGTNPTTLAGYGITDAASSSHTHKYAGSSSAGGAANSVANSMTVQLNGGTTEGTNKFTFNGSAAKTVNITPAGIGAAASSHSHSSYVNQNAFSNVKVGDTTISADTTTDTLTLVGSNVTLTPDATNDKVTIGITKDNVTSALGYTPPTTNTTYSVATTSANGLMSSTDKSKLNGIATGAEVNQNAFANFTVGSTTIAADAESDTLTLVAGSNITLTPDATNDKITIAATNTVYTHPTTAGNKHIPAGGSSGQILRWSADGTAAWGADNNTTYSAATQSAQGLMSAADKKKLDGIATGANAYSLPTASSSTLGGVKTTSTVTSTSGLTACPIISGVPYYKDTNTTYSLSSFGVTATAAELNKLDGVTATATELNYVDGVTSGIQGQLDALDSNKASKQNSIYYIEGTGDTAGTWLGSHDDITAYYPGLTIAYKVGVAGASPTTLNINSLGAVTVVRNVTTNISTAFAVNAIVILTYTVDSDGTAYWKTGDYDANTDKKTASGNSSKKLFLIGATSQSSSGQTTYSHDTAYVGTDGCLYSGGTKVLTAHQSLSDLGITATAAELNALDGITATVTELNYVDGVTSNIQTQLNGKAASSHTHNYAGSSSAGGAANSVAKSMVIKLNGGSTEGTNLFTFNGSGAKTVNITPSAIGAAASSHTHSSYVNQNAFSNIKVGDTTIAADTTTDTLTLVAGSNVTITPDATNDKVTIAATDTVYTHPTSGVTAGTYKSVTVDANGHITAGSNPTTLAGYGITDAASSSHNHSAANITSGTLAVARGGTGVTANPSMLVNLASTTADTVFEASPRPGVTGTLPIANGGTGLTASPSMLTNLGSTTAANVMAASPRPGVTGTLGIANGGTGATTVSGALTNLGLGPVAATSTDGVAYTATVPGITALTVGAKFTMVPDKLSTSKTPTLNVNGLGAKGIRMRATSGTGTGVAGISTGWIAASKPVEVMYNGVFWVTDMNQDSRITVGTSEPPSTGNPGSIYIQYTE